MIFSEIFINGQLNRVKTTYPYILVCGTTWLSQIAWPLDICATSYDAIKTIILPSIIAVSHLKSVIGYRLTVEINVKEEEMTTVKLDTRFS